MAYERPMDAAQYRALSDEAIELRRQDLADELENPESEVGYEQLSSEVALLKTEEARRKAANELRHERRMEKRSAVERGAGAVVEAPDAKKEPARAHVVDRAREALSSPEYMRAFAHYLTHRGAELDPDFAQYQSRDGGSAAAKAAPVAGVLEDAGILVPLTIQQNIIQQLEDRGAIWNAVTKTSVPGGIRIPYADFRMSAKWIGEKEVSDTQVIDPLENYIDFTYHQLECRHANTLLAETISPTAYMQNYANAASAAMVDALETAILNGSGSNAPLGLFNDARLTNKQDIAAADFTMKGYEGKVKNTIARLASGYRNGKLYMAETTWNYYFEGMEDKNGQPVARVNYGIDGEANRLIFGQRVEVLPEKYIPYYDDAAGKCFMFYGDLADYVVNSNMELRADRWEDKDNNLYKSRLIMIVDGKVVDAHGFVKFEKKAG